MSDYIHINQSRGKVLMVLYGGTDALKIGEGVCYNTDFGTAGDAEASRCNRVERPSVSNNKAFAGVAVHNTKAQPAGRFIEIYEPGSRCVPVALGVDTVIDVGLLTFAVLGRYNIGVTDGLTTEAGRFHTGVYRGRGSAVPRQTVTALLESGISAPSYLAAVLEVATSRLRRRRPLEAVDLHQPGVPARRPEPPLEFLAFPAQVLLEERDA